jgi:hypothetical protein
VIVHQTEAPLRESIAFTMSCEGDRLIAILPRPATDWDPKIRLETVASDGSRDMTVEHDGRSATLTSSAPSTSAFQDAPMARTWKLTRSAGSGPRLHRWAS